MYKPHPGRLDLSQLYRCNSTNELRVLLSDGEAVHGITIPCDSSIGSQPQVVKLMSLRRGDRTNFHNDYYLRLGYNSALMVGSATHPEMLYFTWPGNSSPPRRSKSLIPKFTGFWNYFDFDECSGRVVVGRKGKAHPFDFVVYDFSRF